MTASTLPEEPFAKPADRVTVTDHHVIVYWPDGRVLSVPLDWFPRLLHGTPAERRRLKISSLGVHWPDLDEDISYKGLLLGWRSGESNQSIQRWLDYRSRGENEPIPELPLPDDLDESILREEQDKRQVG